MRIVSLIVTVLAVLFSFVAIAFMAMLGFIIAIFRGLFGSRAATPVPPSRPAPGTAAPAAGLARDDVIDVVTTPVAKD